MEPEKYLEEMTKMGYTSSYKLLNAIEFGLLRRCYVIRGQRYITRTISRVITKELIDKRENGTSKLVKNMEQTTVHLQRMDSFIKATICNIKVLGIIRAAELFIELNNEFSNYEINMMLFKINSEEFCYKVSGRTIKELKHQNKITNIYLLIFCIFVLSFIIYIIWGLFY